MCFVDLSLDFLKVGHTVPHQASPQKWNDLEMNEHEL